MLVVVLAAVLAENAPTINADGESITVQATDLVLSQKGTDAISVSDDHAMLMAMSAKMSKLEAELADLRGDAATIAAALDGKYATEGFLESEISAATGTLKDTLMSAQEDSANTLTDRVNEVAAGIVGYPQTVKAVEDLSNDVAYLLNHAENTTQCGADGGVHVGTGECASPVPTCTTPDTPTDSNLVLSSMYLLPGATAKYTCPKAGTFLQGPSLRTCIQGTEANWLSAFDGNDPQCLKCNVADCVLCVDEQDTCKICAEGFGPSKDRKLCIKQDKSVVILGHGHYNGQNEILVPNGEKYIELTATPARFTNSGTDTQENGAGAIIEGTIYVVSGRARPQFHKKLGKGDKLWSTFAALPFDISAPFYATVSGVGAKEDGFYIFDKAGSAVYKPAEDAWTALPLMSGTRLRNMGATAVVGSKIFCIGGYGSGGVSAAMDIFDTAKGQWERGAALPSTRALHAAAAYNNKLYVFGGTQLANNRNLNFPPGIGGAMNSVLSYDLSSGKWRSDVAQMPDAWHTMGTGPMPVLAGGKILLPEASFCDKICGKGRGTEGVTIWGSLQYDAQNDSWEVITSPIPYNRMADSHSVVLSGAFERGL